MKSLLCYCCWLACLLACLTTGTTVYVLTLEASTLQNVCHVRVIALDATYIHPLPFFKLVHLLCSKVPNGAHGPLPTTQFVILNRIYSDSIALLACGSGLPLACALSRHLDIRLDWQQVAKAHRHRHSSTGWISLHCPCDQQHSSGRARKFVLFQVPRVTQV